MMWWEKMNINQKKIIVVMSTYNGENYIETQIESILHQVNVSVCLIVRDDGSTDKTKDILEKYQTCNKLIWYSGDNLKPARSFLDLLKYVENNFESTEYDYIAFADQDDIWNCNKLCTATNHLDDGYDLYFCSMEAFCDEKPELNTIVRGVALKKGEILFRNSVAGCTMVFNKKVLHSINLYTPSYIEMHDSWIMRVCSILEYKMYADSLVLMKYRIHEKNVCGVSISLLDKIKNHLRNVWLNDSNVFSETAHELLNGYFDTADIYYKKLLLLLDRKQKIRCRKIKLLINVLKINFSTGLRKMSCLFKIAIGKI